MSLIVVVRSQRPERAGKWEPVSRSGWRVVCEDKTQALQLALQAGSQLHPQSAGGTELNDGRYLDWLLRHHVRVERCSISGRREMTFGEWATGWRPSPEDVLSGASSPGVQELLSPEAGNIAGSYFGMFGQ